MPHYKTPLGDLHFLDEDVDPSSVPRFPPDAIEISDAEADSIRQAQRQTEISNRLLAAQ